MTNVASNRPSSANLSPVNPDTSPPIVSRFGSNQLKLTDAKGFFRFIILTRIHSHSHLITRTKLLV